MRKKLFTSCFGGIKWWFKMPNFKKPMVHDENIFPCSLEIGVIKNVVVLNEVLVVLPDPLLQRR
jgi:hypothetical protein